jgi:hypothetical protein
MTQSGRLDEEERQPWFAPALSGDVLEYYMESTGDASLSEEIRLCEAMTQKSVAEERFDEARRWISAKAGLVRSRSRGDSGYAAMRETFNQVMHTIAEAHLRGMESDFARADAERDEDRAQAAGGEGRSHSTGCDERGASDDVAVERLETARASVGSAEMEAQETIGAVGVGRAEPLSASEASVEASTDEAKEVLDEDEASTYIEIGEGQRVARSVLRERGIIMVGQDGTEPRAVRSIRAETGFALASATVNGDIVAQEMKDAANGEAEVPERAAIGGGGSVSEENVADSAVRGVEVTAPAAGGPTSGRGINGHAELIGSQGPGAEAIREDSDAVFADAAPRA